MVSPSTGGLAGHVKEFQSSVLYSIRRAMSKLQKKIVKKNERAFTVTHPSWGLTVHFSAKKKNGKRIVTTILD
jgi:hypothetical protein